MNKLSPPPIVFKIVWPILYAFLILFVILLYVFPPEAKEIFVALQLSFWIGILCNFLWSPLYFRFKLKKFCTWLLLFMVGLAVVTLILVIVSDSDAKWVNFFLFLSYTLWLGFASIISLENLKLKN